MQRNRSAKIALSHLGGKKPSMRRKKQNFSFACIKWIAQERCSVNLLKKMDVLIQVTFADN